MKALGVGLVVVGVVLLAVAGVNAPRAPNVSYLVGTFLPGLFCLIVGLKLAQTGGGKPKPRRYREEDAGDGDPDRDDDDDRDRRPGRTGDGHLGRPTR